jgi:MYXO-CTERM domain-containing protein
MTDTRTTAQIEADIELQRDHLADTVDQLSHKLDVKAQAKERAARLRDRATTDSGTPRPEVVAAAVALVAVVAGLVWWRRR